MPPRVLLWGGMQFGLFAQFLGAERLRMVFTKSDYSWRIKVCLRDAHRMQVFFLCVSCFYLALACVAYLAAIITGKA